MEFDFIPFAMEQDLRSFEFEFIDLGAMEFPPIDGNRKECRFVLCRNPVLCELRSRL